ncbi:MULTISPECIES: vitamin K epoxide reductase family protein [unclassified Anaeromyxobacter]|uniref:vitamin K epoxide reductase/DsbA family protein n=1 Tax=unclassified Anaeromyxobacter TaxID=2620896 RepID=UPI001F5844F4|nr:MULTISPECIES: vitamin K epoxide reductase family protein [unclassified Anaeromyxobacter]
MTTHDPAFTEHLHGEPPGREEPRAGRPPPGRRAAFPRAAVAVALAGALLGAVFAALSTSDFMQHLDRQVHAIHCSFLPGAAKDVAASGCRTVMMSPYSSLFRESLWGGIPVSLWALAVFAFLAYRAALLLWRRQASAGDAKVLLAAAALPVAMSVLFGAVSIFLLEAVCKVCIGIYAASALCFAGALLAYRAVRAAPGEARFAAALLEGTALVAAVTLAYVASVPRPDPRTSTQGCGALVHAEDNAGVMIPLTASAGGTPSVEVLDPLCASCKAFDARLAASSLGERLDLKGVLFPLDSRCNWMVTEAIHPGACAVSEAVLCAAGVGQGPKNAAAAGAVLRWAFARQTELRALGARDEAGLRAEIEREFPAVAGCLGGALVRSKLTKSLRWAVANAIPVLTPQLFVGDARMCDEDTDLGLEYTLSRMLSPEAAQERARRRAAEPPRPPPPPPRADLQASAAAAPPEVEPQLRTPAAPRAVEAPPAAPGAEAPPPPPSPAEAVQDEARPGPAPEPTPSPSDAESPAETPKPSHVETER